MQKDRPTKAFVLKDKSVVMLYNIDGDVYCSDANSTAFQYPLTHAKIVKGMSCAGFASSLPCRSSSLYFFSHATKLSTFDLGEEGGGPAVEVPLDGTVYDLETGKVPSTFLFINSQYKSCLGHFAF